MRRRPESGPVNYLQAIVVRGLRVDTRWSIVRVSAERNTKMTNPTQITVTANPDLDDCLQGAADAYVAEHPELSGWDLSPQWADPEGRERVVLTIPADREANELDESDDMVTLESMPEHLCASHRAAGNWGQYPVNGAIRERMTRADAEWEIEHDEDGYAHIVPDPKRATITATELRAASGCADAGGGNAVDDCDALYDGDTIHTTTAVDGTSHAGLTRRGASSGT